MDDAGEEESRDASMEDAPLSKELGDATETIHTPNSTTQFTEPNSKSATYALAYLSPSDSLAQQPSAPSNNAPLTQQESLKATTTLTTHLGSMADETNAASVPSATNTNSEVDTSNASDQRTPPHGPSPEQLKRLSALRAKNASLTTSTTSATHTLHLTQHRLLPLLPSHLMSSLELPQKRAYTPSTAAHTTFSLSTFDTETQIAILKEAQTIIKKHIKQLHEYNEIKDVAQGLIGLIAEQRGVRVVECEGDFGVGKGD